MITASSLLPSLVRLKDACLYSRGHAALGAQLLLRARSFASAPDAEPRADARAPHSDADGEALKDQLVDAVRCGGSSAYTPVGGPPHACLP